MSIPTISSSFTQYSGNQTPDRDMSDPELPKKMEEAERVLAACDRSSNKYADYSNNQKTLLTT